MAAPPQDLETVIKGIAPHAVWDIVLCDKGLHRHWYYGLENLKEHALVQVDKAVGDVNVRYAKQQQQAIGDVRTPCVDRRRPSSVPTLNRGRWECSPPV